MVPNVALSNHHNANIHLSNWIVCNENSKIK